MSDAISSQEYGPSTTGDSFSFGRAFNHAYSVYRQALASFLVLTGVANLPVLILDLATTQLPNGANVAATLQPFIQFIVSPLATATCLFGAYQVMRGRQFTIAESLSVAFSRFWAVIGVSIVGGLLTGFLTLLLIVPGVIYASMIFVALPACVIERLRPMASLRRSRALTKGHRWAMLGMIVFVSIAAGVLSVGAHAIGDLLAGPVLGAFAKFAGSVLVGGFASVLYAVVYRDLRAAKEGVDVEQLASVFD